MSRPNRDPLDEMRRSNPVDAATLRAGLDPAALNRTMATAIDRAEAGAAAADPEAPPVKAAGDRTLAPAGRRRPTPARRRGARGLALAGGLVVLIAAVLLATGAFSGGGTHPTYAAAAVEVAEANPRLLVTAPGWTVTDASEFEPSYGEMSFADGAHELELDWYPARLYRGYLHDRAEVSPPQRSSLLGGTATSVEYGQGDYATILAPTGTVFVEVRGGVGDRGAYEAVIHSLRRVDVDTWLAAMPSSVVSPDARAGVVEGMLRGVPLPPGFDAAALEEEPAVQDHYDLGVRVASAVSCGWVESWLAAKKSGDTVAQREAVAAMASSHHWPLLDQMQGEVKGGWARNVWTFAAQLRAGRLHQDFGVGVFNPDGSGYELGPAWAVGLNCADAIVRKPVAAPKR